MVKAFIARTPAIWRMWLYALLLVIQNAPDGIPLYINFVFFDKQRSRAMFIHHRNIVEAVILQFQ